MRRLTPEAARSIYAEMAKELAGLGHQCQFRPRGRSQRQSWNAVIARRKRSFGADPDTVTSLARSFIAAHREANVVTVAKHFQGTARAGATATRRFRIFREAGVKASFSLIVTLCA